MKRAAVRLASLLAVSLCVTGISTRHVTPVQPRPIDGIRCEGMEGAIVHIHAFLALYDRGYRLMVPAGIGLQPTCQYWLHTHTSDGLIHDESSIYRFFTLGQFFAIWKQPLNWHRAGPLHALRGQRLKITVNGKPYRGNPQNIELDNHTEIVIKSGPPFIMHPHRYRWGNMG